MTGISHMRDGVVEGSATAEGEIKLHGVVVHPYHLQTERYGSSSQHIELNIVKSVSVYYTIKLVTLSHTAVEVTSYSSLAVLVEKRGTRYHVHCP